MPKLTGVSVNDVNKTLHGFQYSCVTVDKLGAAEYTIVQAVVDQTGSVAGFKDDLERMLEVSADSCKKSPRAENLLYRATAFNSMWGNKPKIKELCGFTLLNDLDPSQFANSLNPNGATPLYSATLDAVDALYHYGKDLYQNRILCNAILFIITDGEDNSSGSGHTPAAIKEMIQRISKENIVESFRTILIGVNDTDSYFKDWLEKFRKEAELDEYISMGEVTPGKLAKLAAFVSQSVSSQSQALGSGGPSQPIDFKF